MGRLRRGYVDSKQQGGEKDMAAEFKSWSGTLHEGREQESDALTRSLKGICGEMSASDEVTSTSTSMSLALVPAPASDMSGGGGGGGGDATLAAKIQELQAAKTAAVEEEDYEEASRIKHQIKELRAAGGGGGGGNPRATARARM
jgi:hypothetical protein